MAEKSDKFTLAVSRKIATSDEYVERSADERGELRPEPRTPER